MRVLVWTLGIIIIWLLAFPLILGLGGFFHALQTDPVFDAKPDLTRLGPVALPGGEFNLGKLQVPQSCLLVDINHHHHPREMFGKRFAQEVRGVRVFLEKDDGDPSVEPGVDLFQTIADPASDISLLM